MSATTIARRVLPAAVYRAHPVVVISAARLRASLPAFAQHQCLLPSAPVAPVAVGSSARASLAGQRCTRALHKSTAVLQDDAVEAAGLSAAVASQAPLQVSKGAACFFPDAPSKSLYQ